MSRKIRQLITDLKKAGFMNCGGRGSQRNFVHPCGVTITISGKEGDDALPYQERNVKRVITETTK